VSFCEKSGGADAATTGDRFKPADQQAELMNQRKHINED
jgi:hypothetical protein